MKHRRVQLVEGYLLVVEPFTEWRIGWKLHDGSKFGEDYAIEEMEYLNDYGSKDERIIAYYNSDVIDSHFENNPPYQIEKLYELYHILNNHPEYNNL